MELKAFLFSLITIYIGARIFGELANRAGQSAVFGELLAGVLLGSGVRADLFRPGRHGTGPGLFQSVQPRQLVVLLLAGGLLVAGILGKLAAGVGLSRGVIAEGEYGAILVVVVLTTLLSPILLKLLFKG